MIIVKNKSKCCGCTACASICPKHCIAMESDEEGFLYPKVDVNLCVACGACERVCPVTHSGESRRPLHCYAAKNKDSEVLKSSSSGGVFSLLAEYAIQEKQGVVFGAMWENDRVVHGAVESLDDLYKLRGSKYVQSDLRDCFLQVSKFVKDGRYVLFSGTPCEIAGLKSYLKKDYNNLLMVDLACHGTPSPKVLSQYITELKRTYGVESLQLSFKDKSTGWSTYSVTAKSGDNVLFSERASENIFMKGFLHELFSRPSCHDCAFKSFRSGSDITLADFWGVEKVLPDYKTVDGVSLVLENTVKGEEIINIVLQGHEKIDVDYADAIRDNGALLHSEPSHPQRKVFFKMMKRNNITVSIKDSLRLTLMTKMKLYIMKYLT